jgi:hypothetical protein
MPDEKDVAAALIAAAGIVTSLTTGVNTTPLENIIQEQQTKIEQVENTHQQQNTTQQK